MVAGKLALSLAGVVTVLTVLYVDKSPFIFLELVGLALLILQATRLIILEKFLHQKILSLFQLLLIDIVWSECAISASDQWLHCSKC